jgi:hypothetical protein
MLEKRERKVNESSMIESFVVFQHSEGTTVVDDVGMFVNYPVLELLVK